MAKNNNGQDKSIGRNLSFENVLMSVLLSFLYLGIFFSIVKMFQQDGFNIGFIIMLLILIALAVVFTYLRQSFYGKYWDGKMEKVDPQELFKDVSPGQHIYKLGKVDFHVEIPQQINERQCGLIVDVHGGLMNAQQEDDGTNMRQLGQEYGYVIVQPESPYMVIMEPIDDVIVAMIKLLTKKLNLDQKKIHITGFSLGGYTTWRFIRDHSDFLASAAPMSGGLGNIPFGPQGATFTGNDTTSLQIPVLQLQGTKDPFVSYKSGTTLRDNVVNQWHMGPGKLIAGDSTYRRYRYTNDIGNIFEFIEHDYYSAAPFVGGVAIGGHCFPGGKAVYDPKKPVKPTPFGAQEQASFNWGEEVMKFFIEHPKP